MMGSVEAAVRNCLDAVLDPCSVAKGHPMSIVDLGLFKSARLRDGHLVVELKITAPGCGMAHIIIIEAENVLKALPNIRTVEVSTDAGLDWSPDDMAPHVQAIRHPLSALSRG